MTRFSVYSSRGAAFLALALLVGCGYDADESYRPPSGPNYHPFGGIENHGTYLAEHGYNFTECAACHGADLTGVDNGIVIGGAKDRSCYRCHGVHHGDRMTDARRQHPAYLRRRNWDLGECYRCHQAGLGGEGFGGSCASAGCHTPPLGAGTCNTCHGDPLGSVSDSAAWAPPRALADDTSASARAVGAHRAHLRPASGKAAAVSCRTCHAVPTAWDSPGHIRGDPTPGAAEVFLTGPARAGGSRAAYDPQTATCSSVWCHGGRPAVWNQSGGWSDCTSCHGIPPTRRHDPALTLRDCAGCHRLTVDTAGNIIRPDLHVNGVVDFGP